MNYVKNIVYLIIFCAIWYIANLFLTYNIPSDEALKSLKFSVSFSGASLVCVTWFAFAITKKLLGYISVILFSLLVWVLAIPGLGMAPDSGGEVMTTFLWLFIIAAIFPFFFFRSRLKMRAKSEELILESSSHKNGSNKNSLIPGAAAVSEIVDEVKSDNKLFEE